MNPLFRSLATATSKLVGSSKAFVLALLLIIVWGTTGPLFGFSDTWQLVINTFTTITTFLIVILIQNTQNRDTKAIHLKLDELVRAVKGASLSYLDSENMSEEELELLQQRFHTLHKRYLRALEQRKVRKRNMKKVAVD